MRFRARIFYHGMRDNPNRHAASPTGPAHQFLGIVVTSGATVGTVAEVDAWCCEQFGRDPTRWHTNGLLWEIFDDDDALTFRMRWC